MVVRTRIDSAETTDMTNTVSNITVDVATSETQKYPEWQSPHYRTWLGYYKFVPDLKAIIDAKANWTIGKGYKADTSTKEILRKIRGSGKSTFNSILRNQIQVYTIGGDAMAQIAMSERGKLLNILPMSPDTVKIRANRKGIIKRYEHWVDGQIDHKFSPEEIFHLSWDMMNEEIHGTSTIEAIEDTILSSQEAYADMRIVFHRYVKPLIISVVDTDDPVEIAAYKAKVDKAIEYGENLVVPKGTVDSMERMSVPKHSTLDPIPWLQQLQRRFIIANGVPEIILGHGGGATEATSKILYLAFQQMVEGHQRFIEEQVEAQLDMKIELEFPASLEPAMQEDKSKERNQNNFQMKHDAKK